jgi:uncharacterized membrane protein YfcA
VPDIARTVAIWVCGLLGSIIVGAMIGSLLFNLFIDPAFLGGFAGLLLFVCFRLWMGEGRAHNDLAARIPNDEPDHRV